MYGSYNWYDKVKRYFTFSKSEIQGLIVAILVIGFMFGIDDGRATIHVIDSIWVQHLIGMILIVALAFIVHVVIQKVYALKLGFKAQFKPWYYGIMLALLVVLVSRGSLILILPGGVVLSMMAFHRIGYFRYGKNVWTYGFVGMAGPIANLVLAFIFKLISLTALNNIFIEKAIIINILMAIFTALPIPPLDGSRMFFAYPLAYFMFFGSVLVASILMLLGLTSFFSLIFYSLISGVVLMLVLNLLFMKLWDNK
ncbi:M50 family metallopeptidase [Nanoarchaeota archaeon]